MTRASTSLAARVARWLTVLKPLVQARRPARRSAVVLVQRPCSSIQRRTVWYVVLMSNDAGPARSSRWARRPVARLPPALSAVLAEDLGFRDVLAGPRHRLGPQPIPRLYGAQ